MSEFNDEPVISQLDAWRKLRARVGMTKIVAHVRKAGPSRTNAAR